jgi:hypothetical protein
MAGFDFLRLWHFATAAVRAAAVHAAAKHKRERAVRQREKREKRALEKKEKQERARKKKKKQELRATAASERRAATASELRALKATTTTRRREKRELEKKEKQERRATNKRLESARSARICARVDAAFHMPTETDIMDSANAGWNYFTVFYAKALKKTKTAAGTEWFWQSGCHVLGGKMKLHITHHRVVQKGGWGWCPPPKGKNSVCAVCLREYIAQKIPRTLNGAGFRRSYGRNFATMRLQYCW